MSASNARGVIVISIDSTDTLVFNGNISTFHVNWSRYFKHSLPRRGFQGDLVVEIVRRNLVVVVFIFFYTCNRLHSFYNPCKFQLMTEVLDMCHQAVDVFNHCGGYNGDVFVRGWHFFPRQTCAPMWLYARVSTWAFLRNVFKQRIWTLLSVSVFIFAENIEQCVIDI